MGLVLQRDFDEGIKGLDYSLGKGLCWSTMFQAFQASSIESLVVVLGSKGCDNSRVRLDQFWTLRLSGGYVPVARNPDYSVSP